MGSLKSILTAIFGFFGLAGLVRAPKVGRHVLRVFFHCHAVILSPVRITHFLETRIDQTSYFFLTLITKKSIGSAKSKGQIGDFPVLFQKVTNWPIFLGIILATRKRIDLPFKLKMQAPYSALSDSTKGDEQTKLQCL